MLRHVASANTQYGLAGTEVHSLAHGRLPFSADQWGAPRLSLTCKDHTRSPRDGRSHCRDHRAGGARCGVRKGMNPRGSRTRRQSAAACARSFGSDRSPGIAGSRPFLRRESQTVNVKRVHRLCRKEGLEAPRIVQKRRAVGVTASACHVRHAEVMNDVWTWDFTFARTCSGSALKWLSI